MPRSVWTPQAEHELTDVLYYIAVADGRPQTAQRIGQEIRDLAEDCACGVSSCHEHKAAPIGWRYLQHKRWLIFFRPQADGIEVMRVLDAAGFAKPYSQKLVVICHEPRSQTLGLLLQCGPADGLEHR